MKNVFSDKRKEIKKALKDIGISGLGKAQFEMIFEYTKDLNDLKLKEYLVRAMHTKKGKIKKLFFNWQAINVYILTLYKFKMIEVADFLYYIDCGYSRRSNFTNILNDIYSMSDGSYDFIHKGKQNIKLNKPTPFIPPKLF